MAKKNERQRPYPSSKKHIARQEKERRQTRIILISTIAIVSIAILVVAVPFINQYLIQPRQTVAIVNSDEISTGEWQTQTKYYRYNIIRRIENTLQIAQMLGSDPSTASAFTGQIQQSIAQLDPLTAGQLSLDEMINNKLIIQEANHLGITVTEEEIDNEFETAFGYFRNGTPTPTSTYAVLPTSTLSYLQQTLVPQEPTQTPTSGSDETVDPTTDELIEEGTPTPSSTPYTYEGFRTYSKDTLNAISDLYGISLSDLTEGLRYAIVTELYREKLLNDMFGELSCEENQTWARHILVEDLETAENIADQLADGADFCDLASEFSIDTSNKENCGDLDWFGEGVMVGEFEEAVFNLDVGNISSPIETQFGFHIIQSLGNERRSLEETECQQKRDNAFAEWLNSSYANSEIEIFDYWRDRVPETPTLPLNTRLVIEQLNQPAPIQQIEP